MALCTTSYTNATQRRRVHLQPYVALQCSFQCQANLLAELGSRGLQIRNPGLTLQISAFPGGFVGLKEARTDEAPHRHWRTAPVLVGMTA